MKLEYAIYDAVEILKNNSIASPFLEARILASYVLNISVADIILRSDLYNLNPHQKEKLFYIVNQRSKKVPLSYLIKRREFFGNEFYVDEGVLDPRPDSETLIELVISKYQNSSQKIICEIGCGSGCLIISLLKYFDNWHGEAVDISTKALDIAKKNSQKHLVYTKINFLEADIFSKFNHTNLFDIIISNPPYIPTLEIENLQDEVRLFEPRIALDGGLDGLKFYRLIAQNAGNFLRDDGKIFLEIGYNQFEEVEKIFKENGFDLHDHKRDLNNIIRAVEFGKSR